MCACIATVCILKLLVDYRVLLSSCASIIFDEPPSILLPVTLSRCCVIFIVKKVLVTPLVQIFAATRLLFLDARRLSTFYADLCCFLIDDPTEVDHSSSVISTLVIDENVDIFGTDQLVGDDEH